MWTHRLLVRPTTDVDPGSKPDTTTTNSSDDKTRRDETPSNIKPSDPYDDIIDLDWLGVQGAARLDEPTRPLTPSHIYFPRIQVTKTPTPPRRTRHHTIAPSLTASTAHSRATGVGSYPDAKASWRATRESPSTVAKRLVEARKEIIRSFERTKGNTPRSGGSIAACPMVPSLAARSCIQRRRT